MVAPTVDNPLSENPPPTGSSHAISRQVGLRGLIRKSFAKSAWNDEQFLPEGPLYELINQKEVRAELPNAPSELVDFICKEAKRVFAALLLCELKGDELVTVAESFREHGLTDDLLPIDPEDVGICQDSELISDTESFQEEVFADDLLPADPEDVESGRKEASRGCSNNSALHAFHRLPWRRSLINYFCHVQWKFLAPVFTLDKFDEDLQPNSILPFISSDFQGFGLFDVEIHEDHQGIVLPINGQQPHFAVRAMKVDGEEHSAYHHRAEALYQLRTMSHSHLSTPLVNFTWRGQHFLISQWADGGTLLDFWEEHRRPTIDAELIKEILVQIRGLVDTLATVEYWGGLELDPGKILRFKNSATLGILRINYAKGRRHIVSTRARYVGTSIRYIAERYDPPETIVLFHKPPSRRSTVWSMGCVALEFVIWLLYGVEELMRFHHEVGDSYFTVNYHNEPPTAELHHRVTQWMSHLSQHSECSKNTAIGDLLLIVQEKLLVVALTTDTAIARYRISPAEFRQELDGILEKAGDNRYFYTGTPRENLRGPVEHSVEAAHVLPQSKGSHRLSRLVPWRKR